MKESRIHDRRIQRGCCDVLLGLERNLILPASSSGTHFPRAEEVMDKRSDYWEVSP